MKTRFTVAIAAATAALIALTGCASGAADAPDGAETVTLRVAATTTPMPEVVLAAAEAIGEGYEIELVEVSDYVTPNTLLSNGEIDANFVQHVPFMEEFNEKNGATLVGVQPVYKTVIAFYSREYDSLEALPEGARIVLPQDRSNLGRGLQLLADNGVITLDPAVERFAATLDDVQDNPKNVRIEQLDLLQLNSAYEEADVVFNLPSFARQIGLTPYVDGIAVEDDPQFAVTLVIRSEDVGTPKADALIAAFSSEQVRATLEELDVPAAF